MVHRRLIVHRDPVSDPAQPYGAKYQNVTSLDDTGAIAPLAAPTRTIGVAEVLP